jgi:hypothetical protein
MPHLEHARPPLLTRVVAALSIALVLGLTLLAASPELHGRLHGHSPHAPATSHPGGNPAGGGQDADGDDGCAVTLFAQGLVLPLVVTVLAFAGRMLRLCVLDRFDSLVPAAPRYLLLPSQAPPWN